MTVWTALSTSRIYQNLNKESNKGRHYTEGMSLLLPYHKGILQNIHDPATSEPLILARGLELHRINCTLMQICDSPQNLVLLVNATPRRGIWLWRGARDGGVLSQTRFTGRRIWDCKQRKVSFYCPVRVQRWRAQAGRIFTRVADAFLSFLVSWSLTC